MTAATITHCLNCSTDLHGMPYCGNCGQRNVHQRLVWRTLVDDINSQLLELNLPWFKTIKDLTLNPGKVCSVYAEGHRITYVHPLKYVFYILALLVVIFGVNETENGEYLFPVLEDLYPPAVTFILTNLPLYMLLMSPVAIVIYRILFWRSDRSWVEISCFVFYLIGHGTLLLALAGTLGGFIDPYLYQYFSFGHATIVGIVFFLFVMPGYLTYAAVNFFKSRLDWSLIGSLVGCFVYFLVMSSIPFLIFSVYEPLYRSYDLIYKEFPTL